MSGAITQRANIDKKFADLEAGYNPHVKGKDFQARVTSLRDALKQLNSPDDTGLRLVKVGVGRKHELKEVSV